jgi:hypothetical protein
MFWAIGMAVAPGQMLGQLSTPVAGGPGDPGTSASLSPRATLHPDQGPSHHVPSAAPAGPGSHPRRDMTGCAAGHAPQEKILQFQQKIQILCHQSSSYIADFGVPFQDFFQEESAMSQSDFATLAVLYDEGNDSNGMKVDSTSVGKQSEVPALANETDRISLEVHAPINSYQMN